MNFSHLTTVSLHFCLDVLFLCCTSCKHRCFFSSLSFCFCNNVCNLLTSDLIPLPSLCLSAQVHSSLLCFCLKFFPFFSSYFSDSSAEVMEVDHDRQLVFCETLCVSSLTALSPGRGKAGACKGTCAGLGLLGATQPSNEQVAARLSAPVVTTQLDTRNIAFERSETERVCTQYLCNCKVNIVKVSLNRTDELLIHETMALVKPLPLLLQ